MENESVATSNLTRSTSSIVKQELLSGPDQRVFTAKELFAELRGKPEGEFVTFGDVTGFCSKLVREKVLEPVAIRGKEAVLGNLNKELLRKLVTKAVPGPGGQFGRKDGPHRRPKRVLTRESVRERLLELAVELESARGSLEEFSSAELLAELTKRARAWEKESE